MDVSPLRDPRLRPCPFCGSTAIRVLPQPAGWISVDCEGCGAMKRCVTRFRETLINAWNMRDGQLLPEHFCSTPEDEVPRG